MGWFRFLKIFATTVLGRWDLTWAVFHKKCLFSLFTKGDFLGLLCDSVASLKVYHMSRVWFYMLGILILYQKYLCHMCNLSLWKILDAYRHHTLMFFNGCYQWQIRTIFCRFTIISNLSCYSLLCHSKKDFMAIKTFHENPKSISSDPKIFSFCFIIPTVKWNKIFLLRPSENAKAKIFWFCFIHCHFHNEKFKGLSVSDALQGLMAS